MLTALFYLNISWYATVPDLGESLQKILSIVIPTRNRSDMVSISISSALKYSHFAEILVVSNGDTLKTDIPVEFLKNKSIKIVRSRVRLSMPKNWLYGFRHVKTKWVYFLGDDDFLVIAPNLLYKILLNSTSEGIVLKSKSFKWGHTSDIIKLSMTSQLDALENSQFNESYLTFGAVKKKKLWILQHLNKLPSGTGRSIISTKFLANLDNFNLLFKGTSPDWNTAAHYLYSLRSWSNYDAILSYIGFSKISSTSLARTPWDSRSILENELSVDTPLHSRIKDLSRNCPTTWLSRVDSILQARQANNLRINISDDLIALSAFLTTPRFVIKMYRYIKPVLKTKCPLIILMFVGLFFSFISMIPKKLKLQIFQKTVSI